MIYGLLAGIVYAIFGFGKQGEPPRLRITCGPFQNGMLWINGRHIHHWVLYMGVCVFALWARWYNLAGFSTVMVVHGLSYEDAFDTH